MKRVYLFLFMAIGLSFIATGCLGQRTFKQVRLLMGTPVEISVVARDKENAYETIDLAFGEIKRIERLMSSYEPGSALSRLNRKAGKGFVEVDKELLYIISESIRLNKLSKGAFDITVAPLMEAYNFDKKIEEGFVLPSKEEIKRKLHLVGSDKIIIDEKNDRIRFALSGMKIDLGGIAKGYAVDRAIEVLRQRGIDKALVNLGGNIFALGSSQRGSWQVGIQHPTIKEKIWATIELDNQAVATSGNYERFFKFQGKKYGHIIDPGTGRLVENLLSATIIAKSALQADGLSTAVFVLGAGKGMELIESIKGVEGILITKDRENPPRVIEQIVSTGLEGRLLPGKKRYSRLW